MMSREYKKVIIEKHFSEIEYNIKYLKFTIYKNFINKNIYFAFYFFVYKIYMKIL